MDLENVYVIARAKIAIASYEAKLPKVHHDHLIGN